MTVSRRVFLGGACSITAHPLVTPMAFAATPGDHRLVVILLRGGLDGLDAVRPVGDRNLAALRAGGMTDLGFDLDGFYSVSAGLNALEPLWRTGELAFVHAVSTPYRDKRSHFDGQDILEAGSVGLDGTRDGWLNRMLQTMPNTYAEMAFAVGGDELKILSGQAPVMNWSPETDLSLTAQDRLLLGHVYKDDPEFHAAISEALDLVDGGMMDEGERSGRAHRERDLAVFTAAQLRGDTRIACFSVNGWDTHRNQRYSLNRSLRGFSDILTTLKAELGPIWSNTTVIGMTEFGRTAAMNGTAGTDHGTAGAMILAGGAVRGGRVYGNWPGLDEASLYDRRDLMPTEDVRAYAGSVIGDMYGITDTDIESVVFPGLVMDTRPRIVL
ncbi:MAG: DUF1501 domain-containing protein [Pseudomonadota bacterium]